MKSEPIELEPEQIEVVRPQSKFTRFITGLARGLVFAGFMIGGTASMTFYKSWQMDSGYSTNHFRAMYHRNIDTILSIQGREGITLRLISYLRDGALIHGIQASRNNALQKGDFSKLYFGNSDTVAVVGRYQDSVLQALTDDVYERASGLSLEKLDQIEQLPIVELINHPDLASTENPHLYGIPAIWAELQSLAGCKILPVRHGVGESCRADWVDETRFSEIGR